MRDFFVIALCMGGVSFFLMGSILLWADDVPAGLSVWEYLSIVALFHTCAGVWFAAAGTWRQK